METIHVLAGDFGEVRAVPLSAGTLIVPLELPEFVYIDLAKDVDRVEVQTEESIKKLGDTAVWGLTRLEFLRVAALCHGLLLDVWHTQVAFALYLKDGRKLLAVAPSETFRAIRAATL